MVIFLAKLIRQVAEAVDAQPNEGQARVVRVEFIVRLFNGKSFHSVTCQVNFYDSCTLRYFYDKNQNVN